MFCIRLVNNTSFLFLSVLYIAIPWAIQSWAEYDIRVFAKNEDIKKYPNREHALCVLNHRGDVDWMVGWCLIERIGMLGVSHYLITVSALFSSI